MITMFALTVFVTTRYLRAGLNSTDEARLAPALSKTDTTARR
ncbi:hypothetical protein HMPREF1861_01114 [Corynebacterium kroppenstedtii]|nr:hypothetical protein HMPREF1861_01114 [Corynebacterium kroppenstedtii]